MNETMKALKYLAGVDDYAQRRDGVGFNKFDATLGQELALYESLTLEQERMALAMLQKYHRQLESAGIKLPAETPDAGTTAAETRVEVSAGNIYIYFPKVPSEDTRAAIKKCSGWRFNGDLPGKPWSVAATPENAKRISAITGVEIEVENAPEVIQSPRVNISVSGNTIYVSLPDPRTREKYVVALKSLGARWRPEMDGKPWAISLDMAEKVTAMFPNAPQELKAAAEKQSAIKALSDRSRSQLEINGLGGTPYPFQVAGVEFLQATGGRAILADEMGLGKTIQAIIYLHNNPDALPALVICPASVKINWAREIVKWSPRLRPVIAEGKKPTQLMGDGANVVIINWDLISDWESEIEKWGIKTIIADEAHYAKNPKAQRTQTLRDLAKKCDKAILMTGTPVVNRPAELWTLLNIVQPQTWKSFWEYAKRYCDPRQNGFGWDFSGASNLDELHERIKTVVCRRTKAQVLQELPEKRRVIVPVEFDSTARAEYESAIRRYLKSTKGQINALVEIEAARQAAVKGKLAACLDWIKDMLDANGKLVVFAWHTETIRAIAAAFPGCVTLTGETPQAERQRVVDRFQSDPQCRLFIGNIRAAGTGITLTAASAVAFVEFAWTPGDMEQAFDRIHRIGQRDAVIAYYLVGEQTIDEDIVDLLERKRSIVETIHDGAPRDVNLSILDDLTERLKARYPDA